MQLLLDETLTKMEILSDSISVTREFVNLSKTAGSLLPLYLSINALAAYQSAGPLTAEMAEVSGYITYITLQQRRTDCTEASYGSPFQEKQCSLPTGKEKGCLVSSSSWDGLSKVRKWDLGKARGMGRRKAPHSSYSCATGKCAPPCTPVGKGNTTLTHVWDKMPVWGNLTHHDSLLESCTTYTNPFL